MRPVVLQIFFDEVLEERTRFLGWSAIPFLRGFGSLPGQHFLGDRFGDLPDTPGIPLTTRLKIVVPALATLVNTDYPQSGAVSRVRSLCTSLRGNQLSSLLTHLLHYGCTTECIKWG